MRRTIEGVGSGGGCEKAGGDRTNTHTHEQLRLRYSSPRLKEKIPEIAEVVQAVPEGPALVTEQVDVVLDSVRPFLAVAGGTIECEDIQGLDSTQPTVVLRMEGASATLQR